MVWRFTWRCCIYSSMLSSHESMACCFPVGLYTQRNYDRNLQMGMYRAIMMICKCTVTRSSLPFKSSSSSANSFNEARYFCSSISSISSGSASRSVSNEIQLEIRCISIYDFPPWRSQLTSCFRLTTSNHDCTCTRYSRQVGLLQHTPGSCSLNRLLLFEAVLILCSSCFTCSCSQFLTAILCL